MASTLDQDPSFNLTAYLEQPAPWENSAAAIRGIVISVTVRLDGPSCLCMSLANTSSRLLFYVRSSGSTSVLPCSVSLAGMTCLSGCIW